MEADRNAATVGEARQPTVQLRVDAGLIQRDVDESGKPEELKLGEAVEGDWKEYFLVALQGTTGIADLKPEQKAELAGKIADEVMLLLEAKAPVERAKGRDFPEQLWKDGFKSALQTTAGGTYSKKKSMEVAAKKAVKEADAIADAALRTSSSARWRLAKLYKHHPPPPEPPKKQESSKTKKEEP
jgi:hypothetical protein